jgi:predicted nucleic acid-binding Zn ribbon protein
MNELKRCRNCGRPIDNDQQQNIFSLCYDCFKKVKSSKRNQAIAMLVIGSIMLPFVLLFIIAYSISFTFFRPIGRMIFLTSCAIALIVPIALIISGATRMAKWKTYIKQKPRIAQQEVITTPTAGTNTTAHPKFCPECGSKIKDMDQKFCVNCGKEL